MDYVIKSFSFYFGVHTLDNTYSASSTEEALEIISDELQKEEICEVQIEKNK